ncbi:MAG TPA: LysM peptidoglycan-binding domain-containing protein, partial [Smithellaceae bacterium]|nr:LysM peptidoglycan-binding domain-containing protein [Smithellaceae bacterium]
MMKRQILIFTGFLVLCLSLSFISSALAEQYQVKKGDSLYSISREFGVKISAIQQENSLGGTKLKAGQILTISGNGSAAPAIKAKTKSVTQTGHLSYYIVKKGDTLSLIARKTGVPAKEIAALNNIKPRNLRIGRKLMLAPPPPIKSPAIEETLSDDEADEEMMQSLAPADPAEDNKRNPELLGKWESPDERKLLVKVATGFLGAPYKLGGSTVRGIDCSAFVRKMYAFF